MPLELKKITVNAEDWSRYLKLKSQASAIKREVEALETSFNLPEPAELAKEYKAQSGDKLCVEIVNGNGLTVGKLSIFWFPGSEVPAAWRKRIS